MKRFLKKLGHWTLYAVYLVAFLAAIDYFFFYRPWFGKLRDSWTDVRGRAPDLDTAELDEVRHVDREAMKRLGKARNEKRSSFTRFEKAKGEGIVRLCAFGDSFTEGDEADDAHDYPTRLSELFKSRGVQNVEVLNFGVGGFGFHQAYIMWESVAPGFGCDVVLLGPRGFQPPRDTVFGFIYSWTPFYLHARYIVRDGDVELVEVPGETYGERFRNFFSFVPRWRFLRYNRTAPAFLKALVPENRDLANPFYYDRRPMEEEAEETYRILLARMAAKPAPILVGHYRQGLVELANGVGAESLAAAHFHERATFPYLAPMYHGGPLANDFLARQFHAVLLGRGGEPLPVLEPVDLDWPTEAAPRRALESYSNVAIEIGGVVVGRFVTRNGVSPTKVDALVGFQGIEESVVDGVFAALDLELQPGMEVVLEVDHGSRKAEHRFGELKVIGGGFNLGRVDVDGLDFVNYMEMQAKRDRGEKTPITHGKVRRYRGLFFQGNAGLSVDQLAGADSITVSVGGEPALLGELGELGETRGVWLKPAKGVFRYVRSTADTMPDIDALGESGVVEVVYEHWEDGSGRAPIAGWRKTAVEAPGIGLPGLLSISHDGRVVYLQSP